MNNEELINGKRTDKPNQGRHNKKQKFEPEELQKYHYGKFKLNQTYPSAQQKLLGNGYTWVRYPGV